MVQTRGYNKVLYAKIYAKKTSDTEKTVGGGKGEIGLNVYLSSASDLSSKLMVSTKNADSLLNFFYKSIYMILLFIFFRTPNIILFETKLLENYT